MNQRLSSSIAGVSMALAATVLWGTTGTAQTFDGSQTSPNWIGALRLAVASLFFVLLITLNRWRVTRRADLRNPASIHVLRTAWPWVLLGGACMAAYDLCFLPASKPSASPPGRRWRLAAGRSGSACCNR